jgi:hypothetical protein
MARMLMTGVIPPHEWSMYFLGFVTVLQCACEIVGQLLSEPKQFNNEPPLERLPK